MVERTAWPQYRSPIEAIDAEMGNWEADQVSNAQNNYNRLDGILPRVMGKLGMSVIDGHAEVPKELSLPGLYGDGQIDAALMLINYEGEEPPANAEELAWTVRRQRVQTGLPTAIAMVGYPEGTRRIDRTRDDVLLIAALHILETEIENSVVGLCNDSDTISMSSNYIPVMTRNEYVDLPAMVWGSAVKLELQPGGSDTPMNRILRYLDYSRSVWEWYDGTPIMWGGSMAFKIEDPIIGGGWSSNSSEPNPYGIGEPSRLVRNIWERSTGATGSDDKHPAFRQCARRVGNCAITVSSRREVYTFAAEGDDPFAGRSIITTKSDNPYRRLTRPKVAELASTITSTDPFGPHLDGFDGWLDELSGPRADEARSMLTAARIRLGLPQYGATREAA